MGVDDLAPAAGFRRPYTTRAVTAGGRHGAAQMKTATYCLIWRQQVLGPRGGAARSWSSARLQNRFRRSTSAFQISAPEFLITFALAFRRTELATTKKARELLLRLAIGGTVMAGAFAVGPAQVCPALHPAVEVGLGL